MKKLCKDRKNISISWFSQIVMTKINSLMIPLFHFYLRTSITFSQLNLTYTHSISVKELLEVRYASCLALT